MSNKSKATLEIIMPVLEEAVEKLLRKVEKDSLLDENAVNTNDRRGEDFDPVLYLARYMHRHNPNFLNAKPHVRCNLWALKQNIIDLRNAINCH